MKLCIVIAFSVLISIPFARAQDDPFANVESEAEKAISEAEAKFYDAMSKIRSDYRVNLAKAISRGDRIEVYLLDFEVEDTSSDFLFWDTRLEDDEFPIIPYGGKSKILKRSKLTEQQREDFLPKLQAVIGFEGEDHGGAFCHFPIHGVRIFAGEQIIFQSSFCWKCHNFAISYPDAPAWVGIQGGDLFAAFSAIQPIPQTEIDRFEAEIGGKTTAKKPAEEDVAGQPATRSELDSEDGDKHQPGMERRSR